MDLSRLSLESREGVPSLCCCGRCCCRWHDSFLQSELDPVLKSLYQYSIVDGNTGALHVDWMDWRTERTTREYTKHTKVDEVVS